MLVFDSGQSKRRILNINTIFGTVIGSTQRCVCVLFKYATVKKLVAKEKK